LLPTSLCAKLAISCAAETAAGHQWTACDPRDKKRRPGLAAVRQCEGFEQRRGGSLIETQTQAMIAEETCASHALSSAKITADFS
jgi:hypothetical protein